MRQHFPLKCSAQCNAIAVGQECTRRDCGYSNLTIANSAWKSGSLPLTNDWSDTFGLPNWCEMKRKRFRFLMHKPDYPAEVAAEIQVSTHSSFCHTLPPPPPLSPLYLPGAHQRVRRRCQRHRKPPHFLCCIISLSSTAVFEEPPTPRNKRKRAAPAEDAAAAESAPGAGPFAEHSATRAQTPAQPPAVVEDAPVVPAPESRATKCIFIHPLP